MRVHTNYKTWSRVSIGKTPFRQIFVHTHPVLQKYDGALPPYSPSQRYDCVDRIVRLCRYNQVLDRIIGVGARRDSKSVVWGRREERATTKSIACKLEVEVANLRGHTVLLVGNTVVLAIRDKALRVFQEEGHGVVRLTQHVSASRLSCPHRHPLPLPCLPPHCQPMARGQAAPLEGYETRAGDSCRRGVSEAVTG
ncbi:hypothetical protein BC938DRAFT_479822 [Jimgerdemannia flammicorona]|uniref:Uncharacterized protein n=1 Tax=Jimgerdemannia flammicorona TaxID=994334 RepID=A0A433QK42_9FUNG|nr:hypothetical protein BC938DRAFT_479822 [Jimgerdemannia flammicorona]